MNLASLVGKSLEVDISGDETRRGILVDYGLDIIVLNDGRRYFYIPLVHIQKIEISQYSVSESENVGKQAIGSNSEKINYRKILNNAKKTPVELYVSDRKSLYGYIVSIQTNYLEFYSPLYQHVWITLYHIKWLRPLNSDQGIYNKVLDPASGTNDANIPRTFKEQVKNLEGKVVVFDLGVVPSKVGLLKKVDNNFIELVNSDNESVFLNLRHLKSVYSTEN